MLTERTGAVLTVALLVLSAMGGVATATTTGELGNSTVPASSGDETPVNETMSAADAAYVTSDGAIILVYEHGDQEDLENASGHARMDVSDGVAEFVMSQRTETDATGNLTLLATPDELTADGALVADRPAYLRDLRFDLENVQNRSVRESSMALNSTVAVPEDSPLSLVPLQEARTSGSVTTDATSLNADGSASVQLASPLLPERSHELVLTESDGAYTLEVDESYTMSAERAERWNSTDRAEETLRSQYCDGFETTNVTCSVSLDSHELTNESEDSKRLDVAYTVTVDGVDSAVSTAIVEGLGGPETNVTEAEATELADRIENVTLSRVGAELSVERRPSGGQQASVDWNVSLDGTDDLTLAYVDLLEQIENAAMSSPQTPDAGESFDFGLANSIEQLRDRTEARRAADLETTSNWAFALTTRGMTGQSFVSLNGTATSETSNWAEYVSELQQREVPITDSMRTSIDVRTDDEQIVAEGSASVEDEGMLDRALTEFNRTANETDVTAMIDAMRAAEFEQARLTADVGEGNATVEGVLSVGNGTAVSDRLPAPFSMMEASETSFETGQTAMLMDAGLQSDADEDAIQALSFVGDETDVTMPGEWDEDGRSLASFATDAGETDDGETDDGETETDDETESGDGDGPGFGLVPALIGAAGGAAIAGKRLRDAA
ncbi:S-layer-forming halobacterial major cell surfaceglycoprotein [Halapricum desulfuricans]|uniref:S-layer-forming halobacterial major cell surfaceglycoprotein n=1 Tax=Halapricum desulfuricans TaxID=2841257 RepID=A0A897NRF6_9EURY|nr:hypothetical protein [Halapricum desulfuricans]QSG12776.1 S-layer-forming halobacterial major cell surfaceglycoprotein [Halapricum desulfuricans]